MKIAPNILILETDPKIQTKLENIINESGFVLLGNVGSKILSQHIEIKKADIAIIGPSIELERCMRFIHQIKIVDLSIPILIFANDNFLSNIDKMSPFEDIYNAFIGSNIKEIRDKITDAYLVKKDRGKRPPPPVIIGQSNIINEIRENLKRVGSKDVTVLITGESGTGKELIAQSLHYYSHRNQGPLVKVNCGALPESLLESEIFGFQKGAFTGANKEKPGRLEMAHNGTLFIDEIGVLTLSLQAKFLQILEDKEFTRLGDIEEKLINTRIVVATNSDLEKMVQEESFRKDLFYRLNIINIKAPSLRDRKEDIPVLIDWFLNKYCYGLGKETLELSEKVLIHLREYHWPGNIRELENIVRRIIAMRDTDFIFDELKLEHRESNGKDQRINSKNLAHIIWEDNKIWEVFQDNNYSMKKTRKVYVSDVEQIEIEKALQSVGWNRRKAAEILQISYKTIINRIAEFGLKP